METFHSEKIHAAAGKPIFHDVVSVKNGKGFKLREMISRRGKTIKRMRKPLTNKEIKNIMTGNFVPGLWTNCLPDCGAASHKKSRRNSRR